MSGGLKVKSRLRGDPDPSNCGGVTDGWLPLARPAVKPERVGLIAVRRTGAHMLRNVAFEVDDLQVALRQLAADCFGLFARVQPVSRLHGVQRKFVRRPECQSKRNLCPDDCSAYGTTFLLLDPFGC